jgi:hypothetical protein
VPAFANLFSFDAGLGRFIFSESSHLVVPSGAGGVQTISRTTGAVTASLPGVLSEIHAACYDTTNRRLWLFDQNQAKGVSIQVGTAGQLTYSSSFSIANCNNIVRVVFDSTAALLFVINDHRIVSFSTATWDEPALSVDYGVERLTFSDFAKIGTNQYWIGTKEPSYADAVSGPFGEQFGAWDSVNAEMQIVCPKMSRWTVNRGTPYWTITTINLISTVIPPVLAANAAVDSACPSCTSGGVADSYSFNAGALSIVNSCNASLVSNFSTGTVTRTGEGTNCMRRLGSRAAYNNYVELAWSGTNWTIAFYASGSNVASFTAWAAYLGPTTPCSPVGTYTYTAAAPCTNVGASTLPTPITVSA